MNLLQESWVPVVARDGRTGCIAPWQLSASANREIAAPRPDFQGAVYQFLIGLLQTAFAPTDHDEWLELWRAPPTADDLKVALEPLVGAFQLLATSENPAFLQDFDMPDGEQKPIAALLIDAPGGKTLKDNLDHFVKGGMVSGVCESCAAMALFTLQTNAPSGGVGHRVGLRGGGPLTTLLIPPGDSSLWHKLWLNVLPEEILSAGKTQVADAAVFPWMAPTRTSEKNGLATLPSDVNPLQMYWGTPRRIRLEHENNGPGACDLCGTESARLITHFRTRNYGVNYYGPWVHPLTPYRFDPKKQNPPLSLKGQQGGMGYRHWLSFNWCDDANGDQAALNVRNYNDERQGDIEGTLSLWCFGYDMDNMKARCWYEQQMPVMHVNAKYQLLFIQFVSMLTNTARDVVKEVRSQVKAAWFSRPKDVKGDTSMIDSMFWQATESEFYQQLFLLADQPENTRHMPSSVAQKWLRTLNTHALDVFDHWVLEGDAEDMDMKRITRARRELARKLKTTKSLKNLEQIATATTEVA